MGLIQRIIEEKGISTISVSLAKEITEKVKPPRAVYTGFPLGHPLSFPGQSLMQLQLLRFLLKQFKEINEPGTIIDFDSTPTEVDINACGYRNSGENVFRCTHI